jgi:PAS domain S-box-containing protein
VPDGVAREILDHAGVGRLVIAGIPVPGAPTGALVMAVPDAEDDPAEWLVFARTVGAQLGQAIALARTARTNELLLESTGEGIVALDVRGCVTFANQAAVRLLGRTAEEVKGVALHDVVHARPGEAHCAFEGCGLGTQLAGRGHFVEGSFLRKDGSQIPVEYDCRPIREGDLELGFVMSFRNISERQQAERLAIVEVLQRHQLRIKDEFLTHVSHELRTPLTAMREFTTILLDGLAGELRPEQRDYLGIILRNADELRSMIDDLLEAARSEMARLTVRPTRVALPVIIDEVIAHHAATARAKGIRLRTDLRSDVPPASADPIRVRQILGNLIGNALKFTPEGGQITVHARLAPEPGAVQVSVADSGPGVPAESVDRLFDYMYQGPNTVDLPRRGFGIGLHLCKDLVTRQNGRIWVDSAPGRGSTFCFTLPVHSAPPVTEAVPS